MGNRRLAVWREIVCGLPLTIWGVLATVYGIVLIVRDTVLPKLAADAILQDEKVEYLRGKLDWIPDLSFYQWAALTLLIAVIIILESAYRVVHKRELIADSLSTELAAEKDSRPSLRLEYVAQDPMCFSLNEQGHIFIRAVLKNAGQVRADDVTVTLAETSVDIDPAMIGSIFKTVAGESNFDIPGLSARYLDIFRHGGKGQEPPVSWGWIYGIGRTITGGESIALKLEINTKYVADPLYLLIKRDPRSEPLAAAISESTFASLMASASSSPKPGGSA